MESRWRNRRVMGSRKEGNTEAELDIAPSLESNEPRWDVSNFQWRGVTSGKVSGPKSEAPTLKAPILLWQLWTVKNRRRCSRKEE